MGPHSYEQGNRRYTPQEKRHERHNHEASMGPHSYEQGNTITKAASAPSSTLQWGLTLTSKETIAQGAATAQVSLASMGPHSYEQGNDPDTDPFDLPEYRFNGASLLRARKQPKLPCPPAVIARLQWGLTLTSKETLDSVLQEARKRRLQWGLTLTSKETALASNLSASPQSMLQWGLTLTSKETGQGARYREAARNASMGPHSYEQGNWSEPRTMRLARPRFNGASLLRARKRWRVR